MQFTSALIISIVVAAVVYGLLRYSRRRVFSSLTLAMIVGLLVLGALANPMDLVNTTPESMQLYGLIALIVVVVAIIYICVKVEQDVDTGDIVVERSTIY